MKMRPRGLAQPQKISVFIDRECVHFAMVCQLKAIRPAGLDEIVKDMAKTARRRSTERSRRGW